MPSKCAMLYRTHRYIQEAKPCQKCHLSSTNCICDILAEIESNGILLMTPLPDVEKDVWQDPETRRWCRKDKTNNWGHHLRRRAPRYF